MLLQIQWRSALIGLNVTQDLCDSWTVVVVLSEQKYLDQWWVEPIKMGRIKFRSFSARKYKARAC